MANRIHLQQLQQKASPPAAPPAEPHHDCQIDVLVGTQAPLATGTGWDKREPLEAFKGEATDTTFLLADLRPDR